MVKGMVRGDANSLVASCSPREYVITMMMN
jgi:hypothetical protein